MKRPHSEFFFGHAMFASSSDHATFLSRGKVAQLIPLLKYIPCDPIYASILQRNAMLRIKRSPLSKTKLAIGNGACERISNCQSVILMAPDHESALVVDQVETQLVRPTFELNRVQAHFPF